MNFNIEVKKREYFMRMILILDVFLMLEPNPDLLTYSQVVIKVIIYRFY